MGKPIVDAAKKLRESASRLNALTDEAAECVAEVERFLNDECSLGIPAFVKVKNLSPEGERAQYLEYRRVGNRFRIAVSCCWIDDPESEDVKPWSDCSRDEKLETIRSLPELLVSLTKAIDQRVIEAESTMAEVATVLQLPSKKKG